MQTNRSLFLFVRHVFWYLMYLVKYFEYELWIMYLLTHAPVLVAVYLGQIDRIKWVNQFGRSARDASDRFSDGLSNNIFFEKRLKKLLVNIVAYASVHGLLGKNGKKIEELAVDLKEGAIEAIGLSIIIYPIYNMTLGFAIYNIAKRLIAWFVGQF